MAFDPEERKRRRQELAAKRRENDKKKKKLLIRLGIAAAVLLVCLIVLLALPGGDETPDTPPQLQQTEPAGTQPPETTEPAEQTLHLVFGGDLNVTDRVVASGTGAYDYTETFLDVAHLLADADLTALNFEGILADAPYGGTTGSAPQGLATALANAGVDAVQLANSCSLNKGLSGLATTIDNTRTAGMAPLGGKKSNENTDTFVIYEIRGVRIALVAFTKGMDGLAMPPGSEGSVNVLYEDYDGMS